MLYAEELVVREVSPVDAVSEVAGLLRLPQWNPSHFVSAGSHSIRYDYQTEIRFGPALYNATITGPMGSVISTRLRNRAVFAPNSPYQSDLGWYAFAEWRGDWNGQGHSAISIFDLARGKIVATQIMKLTSFAGWRGGESREYIVQEHVPGRCSDWFACDARTGEKRLLFHGGYEGHISADGRFLLVLHTRKEVFAALISIDSAIVLDLKQASAFQRYVQDVIALETVSFDAQATRLTAMLNWTRTNYQTSQITFDKLIRIEVGRDPEPGIP